MHAYRYLKRIYLHIHCVLTNTFTHPPQVLVKNEFAGINFIDTYHRSGLYKRELPFIGGQEGGGVIAQVTPKVW
jgi:NADPH:quinone reductase-like Zn-dependent oxidoreductase